MALTVEERAVRHSEHMTVLEHQLFMLGFHTGMHAEQAGENTARVLQDLILADDTAQAAGYLEGLAASRRPSGRCQNVCSHEYCRLLRIEDARRYGRQEVAA